MQQTHSAHGMDLATAKEAKGEEKKKKEGCAEKKKEKKRKWNNQICHLFASFLWVHTGEKKEKKENKNSVAVEIRWQTLLRPYPQIIYSSMKTEEKRKIQMKKLKDKDWCESKTP